METSVNRKWVRQSLINAIAVPDTQNLSVMGLFLTQSVKKKCTMYGICMVNSRFFWGSDPQLDFFDAF